MPTFQTYFENHQNSNQENIIQPSDGMLEKHASFSPENSALTNTATNDEFIGAVSPNFEQLSLLLDTGGPIMAVLLLMSLVALTTVLIKCWQLATIYTHKNKVISQALSAWLHIKPDAAIQHLNQSTHPAASVLKTAMQLKTRAVSDDIAREEVTRLARRELVQARSHLKILELIATLSPLLGLLGTVIGMIEAFRQLQGAGSTIDPSVLSGGIWEALLTTAAGLIVAIPTIIALNWLEQRVERFKLLMEDTITQVFTSDIHHSKQLKTPSNVINTTAAA